MGSYELLELKIELTHKCPLACVHCSSEAHINNDISMKKEKCMEILEDAISMCVKEIAFSGGEPLEWDGLAEVISICSSNGIKTAIYSSGYTENVEIFMSQLAKAGLKRAIFSLYSENEEEHIRITRIRDSFQKTLEAIRAAKKSGIEPEIHFVAMQNNYQHLSQIAELAKSNGVNRISVLRFVPQGRGALLNKRGLLTKKQNKELQENIIRLRDNGFDIRTGSPWNVLLLNKEPKCMAAQDRMIISPNLRIYPCDAFKQIDFEVIEPNDKYSIIDKKPLKECWDKSAYFNIVRQRVEAIPDKPCRDCSLYTKCRSGCLAQKYIVHGNLKKNPDPMCLRGEL